MKNYEKNLTERYFRTKEHFIIPETSKGKKPNDSNTLYTLAKDMISGEEPLDENKLLDLMERMNLYGDEIFDLFNEDDYYGLLNNKDFIVKLIEKTGATLQIAICASSDVTKQILQDKELMTKILKEQMIIPNFSNGEENLGIIIYQLMYHDKLLQDPEFMKQFMANMVNITKENKDSSNYELSRVILNIIKEKCSYLLNDREFFKNLLDSIDGMLYDEEKIYLPPELCSDIEIVKKYLQKGGIWVGISSKILFSPELQEFVTENEFKDIILDMIAEKIEKTNIVVTHFGDDLDNKAAIEALQRWSEDNDLIKIGIPLKVIRVPAGEIKQGYLNVDTGGHNGSRYDEDGTVIIDGDLEHGVKSACEALSKLGVYIPKQIVELADTKPNGVSALDSRSGLSLVRHLNGAQTFKLAEAGLLDKALSDEQLQKFGLTEAHNKQQAIIDNAIKKIEKYTEVLPNGEKIVLSPEPILAGSAIAYELGIKYYVSASAHLDENKVTDGVTFAITSKPGCNLPEQVLEYGRQLAEKYKINSNASGVFVSPDHQMIVAGGPKNPNFKITNETVEGMLSKIKAEFIGKNQTKSIEEIAKYVETNNDTRKMFKVMKTLINEQLESQKEKDIEK